MFCILKSILQCFTVNRTTIKIGHHFCNYIIIIIVGTIVLLHLALGNSKIPNLIEFFESLQLPEDVVNRIWKHQIILFLENAKIIFNNTYKKTFDRLSADDRILIAKRDLAILNNLIARDVNIEERNKLASIFSIQIWEQAAVELENIINNNFDSTQNYDIHCLSGYNMVQNYTNSEVIYQYRKYIINYIKDDEAQKKISGSQRKKDKTASKIGLHLYTYVQLAKNSGAIKDLLDSLINNKVIADKKITNFKKIFNNQIPALPIIWLLGYKALAYFIKLIHLRYRYIKPLGNNIWTITATLFVMEDGTPFDFQVFRQAELPSKEVIDLLVKVVAHLE